MGVRLMRDDDFENFFRPLIAEVGTAKHEKWRDHRREEIAQHQSSGKQNKKLIAKRSQRVINDDTCRLDPRLGSLGYDIVKGSCRHLCDGRDIVKKGDQSDAQKASLAFQIIAGSGSSSANRIPPAVPKVFPLQGFPVLIQINRFSDRGGHVRFGSLAVADFGSFDHLVGAGD
jgi:hypothetical protein